MNQNKIYAYARISTPKQNIDRQIRNIKNEYNYVKTEDTER